MSSATLGNASRSAAGLTALLVVALEVLSATNVCFHSQVDPHLCRKTRKSLGLVVNRSVRRRLCDGVKRA